jgi:membrane protease YdiL (CAAX protease family)
MNLFNFVATAETSNEGTLAVFWVIVIASLVAGTIGPILTKKESTAAHVIGWVAWFFFAIVASQFILALLMVILNAAGEDTSSTIFTSLFQALTYFVMFTIMILLPVRRWKEQQLQEKQKKAKTSKKNDKAKVAKVRIDARPFILKLSGLNRKPTLDDVKKFASFFPLYFVVNIAASIILVALLGAEVMEQEQKVGFTKAGNTPISLVLIGFCLVLLAPLFEEMLVRGVLFNKLREKLKFWPVALITASIFALIHGQFNVGVMTFILAMFAAYLREKTGAIWSSVMLHSMQNFIAFCLLFLLNLS